MRTHALSLPTALEQSDAHHEYAYAGFGLRLLAYAIDSVALLIVSAVCLALGDWFGAEPSAQRTLLLYGALPAALTIACWLIFRGTPGKVVLGMSIVDARTGGPLSLSQVLIRYVGYLVATLPAGLGFFWIAIHPQGQGFHDILARSVVVRRRKASAEAH